MFTTKVQKSNVKDSNVKTAKIGVFAAVWFLFSCEQNAFESYVIVL